jgi:phosphopantothenoylcysteine decarboxylase/phosphopantothenate--cysteine ligase
MLDPLTIVDMAAQHFSPVKDLQHLNIMITAGPTREPLDPVRYITNHSSGKMGFAIAAAAAPRGERHAGERPGFAADAAVCTAN